MNDERRFYGSLARGAWRRAAILPLRVPLKSARKGKKKTNFLRKIEAAKPPKEESMLYLIRHGESEYNRRGLLCGRHDSPLTDNGRAAAVRAGEQLKDIPLDAAFCSPLRRAKETCRLVLSAHGSPVPEITEDRRIIERNFGYFEGKPLDGTPDIDRRWDVHFDGSVYGMESLESMVARVRSFLQDLKERFSGKNVLAVSHNGTIRAFRLLLENYPPLGQLDSIAPLGIGNAQILCLPF